MYISWLLGSSHKGEVEFMNWGITGSYFSNEYKNHFESFVTAEIKLEIIGNSKKSWHLQINTQMKREVDRLLLDVMVIL